MIAGGMTGDLRQRHLRRRPARPGGPGSIIAVYAQTAQRQLPRRHPVGARRRGGRPSLVAALLLKTDRAEDEGDLAAATASMEAMKGKKSSVASHARRRRRPRPAGRAIKNIVFACDAGMGSSAMGASVLRKKIQAAGYADVTVVNKAIANLDRRRRSGRHPPGPDRPGPREDARRRSTSRWTTS